MTRPTIRMPRVGAALPASCAAIRAMAGQIADLAAAHAGHSGEGLSEILLDLQGLAAQIEGHGRDMAARPDADGGAAFMLRAAAHLQDIETRLRSELRSAGLGVASGEDR